MKKKLWTKYFIFLTVITFLLGVSATMLNSPLPMYAKHIGANDVVVGLVTGIFTLAALLCRPFFGSMLDSKGRRTILILGIATCCIMVLLYNWSFTIVILLVLRFFHGIGFSAYTTACGTIASDLIPREMLIEGFSNYGIFLTMSAAIGPTLGLTLAAKSSYITLFAISFLLIAASMVLSFFINYEKGNEGQKLLKAGQPAIRIKGDIFEKTAVPTSVGIFFIAFTNGAVMTFLPVYALSRGIENIGAYFTVNAVIILFIQIFISRLTDRYGISRVVFAGMAFLTVSMSILSLSVSLPMFMTASVFNGLGMGTVFPIMNSLVVKFCPEERKGAANATYYSALDMGVGAGSIIGGIISQVVGYSFLYITAAVNVVMAFFVFLFAIQRQLNASDAAQVGNQSTGL